jgi:hypothetical protein
MSCRKIERWLNDGMPPDGASRARRHAAACAPCAALLAEELRIEASLARAHEPAPDGFADRVMRRVAATAQEPLLLPPVDIPWWTRAISEPASAAAFLLAIFLIWRFEAAWGAAVTAGQASALAVTWFGTRLGLLGADLDPAARASLWLGAAPALGLFAIALFRWFEAATRRSARGGITGRI